MPDGLSRPVSKILRSFLMKHILIVPVIAAGFWLSGAQAADTSEAVIEALNEAGYAQVRDVKMDDGLWEAEVGGAEGRWHDLHVVPGTGEILDPMSETPIKTAVEIATQLEAAGYTQVHGLDLDEAVWEVDAVSPDGSKVDLRINGFDGRILVTESDG
jgi:uncharacterized membrane protein YkoI